MLRICMVMAALLLAACDKPGEEEKPGVIQADDAQISEAVEEASRHSGEQADESEDCGDIEWLLGHLPEKIDGLTPTYRGCEAPVTAMVVFEEGERSHMASITVLDPALAGLDSGAGAQWARLLDETRRAVLDDIAKQVPFTQVRDDEPQPQQPEQLVLDDGTGALLFHEQGEWQLLGIVQHDYAIKFVIDDPAITTTEQARERVLPMLESLDLPLAHAD